MQTHLINNKPNTIGEISIFLTTVIEKVISLTPASFGKFTADRLPDDYLYNKWIGKKKDFADVYLNMDDENRQLFIKYVIGQDCEHSYYLAATLQRFFLFCWNYDSSDFTENPFTGKYKDLLCKKATGKKNPNWITSKQVQLLFHKLDRNGKEYITWCIFGVKK
jgi:hypothetical protein